MNMPAADPLANLRDLHTPPAIEFWPLAPGWWALAIISICLIAFALHRWRRYQQRSAFKKAAQSQIKQLSARCDDDSDYLQQLNRLLKQTALAVNPRQDIASLHGSAWLQFLDQHSNDKTQPFINGVGQVLGHGPYQANTPLIDRAALNQLVSRWIKQQSIKRLQT